MFEIVSFFLAHIDCRYYIYSPFAIVSRWGFFYRQTKNQNYEKDIHQFIPGIDCAELFLQ